MAADRPDSSRPSLAEELASAGGRAAARTLRPFTSAGIAIERLTLDRVLESDELERILLTALESPHLQAALGRALESGGAQQLADGVFDSGLFDHLIDHLIASDGLWRLVDEIAGSPAVAAAISEQGLGFADRVGDGLRVRARQADHWLESAVGRITRQRIT